MIKPVKSLVLFRPCRDDLRDFLLVPDGQPGCVDIGAVRELADFLVAHHPCLKHMDHSEAPGIQSLRLCFKNKCHKTPFGRPGDYWPMSISSTSISAMATPVASIRGPFATCLLYTSD